MNDGGNSSILVFDVGSSALKAVVYDPAGAVVASAEAQYGAGASPVRLFPGEWWRAAKAAMRSIDGTAIACICLTGTMENLIPVDATGEPLGEALLYSDACGAPFLAKAMPALAEAQAERLCGNAPEPLMTAFKLMWLSEHDRPRFEAARWFLPGAKDFLAFKLSGEAVTDPSCAATTGLMDIAARDWSDTLCSIIGVKPACLPRIVPATGIAGRLTVPAAAELGLAAGIPVINGCGDGAATTIGGGADAPSDISLHIGTSGWVARVVGPTSLSEPSRCYRLPHPLGDNIIEIAPILAAGAAASWTRQTLGLDLEAAEGLARQADGAPGDAVFLPYLNGERSPFLDLDVRAAFLGLSSQDGSAALYYAALEGVAFAIDANLRAMGGGGRQLTLVGGGALSPVWRQVIADIVGLPISVPAAPLSATSFGAFRIARQAMGWPAAAGGLFPVAAVPRPERAARVDRQRERFAAATAFVRHFA